MGFMGFKRADGSCGIRNHVVVMGSVSCVNGVVNAVGRALPEVKAITHTEGCGRGLKDIAMTKRALIGLGKNPNVGAIVMVGLGCEFIKATDVAREIEASGKPVAAIMVQEKGGSKKATRAAIESAKSFLQKAAEQKREECGWDKLVLGLECGGSDALSGVTANPVVGVASDWLVREGGTSILTETTELIGTEKLLARRAATPELGDKLTALIQGQKKLTEEILGPLAGMVISPGNIEGGLSNIAEKAMGCVIKGGTSGVGEVLDYGQPPTQKGLVIMDAPGSDIFSLTGLAAGGANLMVFTTGRGTPAGFPIVPVIKIASNSELFEKMNDDMDLDAGRAISGKTIEEIGLELVGIISRVAGGEKTKAEENLQDVFAIHTVGPAF